MPDLDVVASNYRRAQQRWPDAPTLARCHEALRASFDTNAYGLVEHVKSFIESVCLTIMGELREPMPSSTPSTTDLLVAALSPLGLRNSRGASKLDKVLSGFNRLAEALTEMRNDNGPVAHGKDAFLDSLTADHARAFLHVGDAILGVLLNALEGKQPDLTVTREPYESFPHLNERIDRAVSVEVRIDEDGERPMVVFSVATGPRGEAIELRVEPSRLLYGIDRSAYIEVLRTADLMVAETEEDEAEEQAVGSAAPVVPNGLGVAPMANPLTDLVPAYEGRLEPIRAALEDFLSAEGVNLTAATESGDRLADSLLATAEQNMGLDWIRREPLQARLKVACKRVLVQFGSDAPKAEEIAERLVGWLRVQAPEVGTGIPMAPAAAQEGVA
jgi:Abortive infection C-terminus